MGIVWTEISSKKIFAQTRTKIQSWMTKWTVDLKIVVQIYVVAVVIIQFMFQMCCKTQNSKKLTYLTLW